MTVAPLLMVAASWLTVADSSWLTVAASWLILLVDYLS